MDHPEKILFEEVKGLKTQMEEVRNRIFKIEATYVEKVENIEKREYRAILVDKKIAQYKESLTNRKIIVVDGYQIPLFKNTVENNIYKSEKLLNLFQDLSTQVILDQDYKYFSAILDIIKKGHNFFTLDACDQEEIKRKFTFNNKQLEKDPLFIKLLKEYFSKDIMSLVIMDFNVNLPCIPDNLEVKSISNTSIGLDNLTKYKIGEDDKNDMLNEKNKKAIFLDYNKQAIVELNQCVRIKAFALKPFTEDTSAFYPTTGSYYPSIFISEDSNEWTNLGVMPSTYGSPNDDYLTYFNIGKFRSVKYFKFVTNGSAQLSISYIKI